MPDYIYLLENRLNPDQQNALRHVAEAARQAEMNVFLVGGAVRDLTSGSSVRDLDIAVQGNALKLKKTLLKQGGTLWGENEEYRTLFLHFPRGVRVEVSSTRREEYPKPGKPVYHWDSIHEDLRRRDFTANAMALSVNERSYGLLMDPLNGFADIESRHLRLVNNYGFLEAPSRLLRATRLKTRLGWDLEERTRARYENAKQEGAIQYLSSYEKGYELEEIGHEEDGLQVLAAMEREGWMEHLFPAWTTAKADTQGLSEMHRLLTQLQVQGVNPDASAASMELLTAKLQSKEVAALKKSFVCPGFVEEWGNLEEGAKEFQKQLTSKVNVTPSATWKLFTSADPKAVLWLGFSSKSQPVQAKYKNFLTVWPEERQKIPHALMQELRITPDVPGYDEMLAKLFLETIDGKLETEEQLRKFLEPYSPPAPPPPVTVRRTRASRKTAEPKIAVAMEDEDMEEAEDLFGNTSEEHEHDLDTDLDEDEEETPREKIRGAKESRLSKSEQREDAQVAAPKEQKKELKKDQKKELKKEQKKDVAQSIPSGAAAAESHHAVSSPPRSASQAKAALSHRPGHHAADAASGNAARPAKKAVKRPAAAKAAPVKAAPVKAAPVKTAPVKAAPVKAAPVKAAPVKTTPVKAAPVKTTPVKAAPVKAAPARHVQKEPKSVPAKGSKAANHPATTKGKAAAKPSRSDKSAHAPKSRKAAAAKGKR